MSGTLICGRNTATDTIVPVEVNADGTLEMTAEIDSSGLATKLNQTNGDQKAKCMGGETDGTQQQILVSNLGVVQTLDSEVFGKTSQIANQTTLSNTNEATIIANQTNGTQVAKVGNTVGDGSGTATSLKTASDGSVHVVVENSDNVLIKGVQDGTTTQKDAKTNSNGDLRSALIGNTAKDGTGDNYYLVCDADGKLETSGGGGGGGGDASAANQTTMITELQNIDTTTTAMSAKLPTSLGQKANASSLSICRSTTAGAFDLSARTTIATAGTSTKLLCDSAGVLQIQPLRDAVSTTISTTNVLANGTFESSSVNMNGFSELMVIGNTTNISDSMYWEFSFDNGTFYRGQEVYYDFSTGDFAVKPSTQAAGGSSAGGGGAQYMRLTQTDTTATAFSVQFASSKR